MRKAIKYPIVVFDLVGTLTDEDAQYRRIHTLNGCEKEAKANVSRYLAGELNEEEMIRANVALHKGVSQEQMWEAAKNVELREGAEDFIKSLRKHFAGKFLNLVLLTSDYSEIASLLESRLGFNYIYGCDTLYEGKVHMGVLNECIWEGSKLTTLLDICKQSGFNLGDVLYVGNDHNDRTVMNAVRASGGYCIGMGNILRGVAHEILAEGDFEGLERIIIDRQRLN